MPFKKIYLSLLFTLYCYLSSYAQDIQLESSTLAERIFSSYILYALIFVGLIIVAFIFFKNRILLKTQLELQHQEAERLKDMNEFKTRLYANITHEFRTPLTVILGLSDLMMEKADELTPEKIKEHMGLVASNGNNLLHLINQILDLSKLESSNMSLDLIQANISNYIESIVHSFQPFANTQKINLSFQSDAPDLKMDFDKNNLFKIVSNLVSNALKYTNEGGKVKVVLEKKNENVLIKIIDTGIGIPKEALPHIFDRFFQATTDQLQKQIGTGIGLSLTQELVKLSDGNIRVDSEIGIGTQFHIELPIHNTAPIVNPETSAVLMQKEVNAYTIWPQPKKEDTITIDHNNEENLPTLLIVEDNKDIIIYLKTILEPFYHLEVGTDGKMGVDKALEIIPDIIVSDVMMPKMDGFEVCNFLKNDERTSHIPIVLLTAKSEIQSRLHGLERGADAYLSKPFNKNELLIRLQKLVELRQQLKSRYVDFKVPPPSEDKAVQIEDAFIEKLRTIVEKNLDDPRFGVQELCKAVNLSRMQVHRKIKALSGASTTMFIRSIRLQKAKLIMLTKSQMNISEIAYEVGFNDPNYFSRAFNQQFGKSPSKFLNEKNNI